MFLSLLSFLLSRSLVASLLGMTGYGEDLDVIEGESAIGGHDRKPLDLRLGNQEAVEGVTVVLRELRRIHIQH